MSTKAALAKQPISASAEQDAVGCTDIPVAIGSATEEYELREEDIRVRAYSYFVNR